VFVSYLVTPKRNLSPQVENKRSIFHNVVAYRQCALLMVYTVPWRPAL